MYVRTHNSGGQSVAVTSGGRHLKVKGQTQSVSQSQSMEERGRVCIEIGQLIVECETKQNRCAGVSEYKNNKTKRDIIGDILLFCSGHSDQSFSGCRCSGGVSPTATPHRVLFVCLSN